MKKISNGILVFLMTISILILISPSKIYALNSTSTYMNSKYNNLDYVIDKYDISIIVNEDNTFDITENITAYFNVEKHGIYRTIPLKNTITRLDGTKSTNRAQITNLSVNNEYKTYRENNNYKIQIGSADKTLTGEQNYTIKYKYNIGKDPVANYDELYYNLIGTEWDTVIGNITFTIMMPKEFDASKLGFSSGIAGATINDNIKYNIEGNKIIGSYNGVLNPREALTVRLELPEGYFVGAGLAINYLDYFIFILPILFLGISIFLWYKYGRDNQVIETVEFYPPEELNSLEIGFLYKGEAGYRDVTSLLIYLANKGYIKISEIEEKSKHSNDFEITKLKEYDGNNNYEMEFLKGLFSKRRTNKNEKDNELVKITKKDLYNRFYKTMNKIMANVNSKTNRKKIFEIDSSSKIENIIMIMIIFSLLTINIIPILKYAYINQLETILIFMLFGVCIVLLLKCFSKQFRVIWLIFIIFPSLLTFNFLPIIPMIWEEKIFVIGVMLGMLCIIGMLICFICMTKRTVYGSEILGRIKGFKTFLKTAEKDKLEEMVMENPNYFYDILPYTYVLGVSNKWIKKFEAISLQEPSWYNSSSEFSINNFHSFMDTTMSSAKSAMSSSPSSSSGSSSSGGFSSGISSSGGGSSGGGSGGGGGGSW